WKYIWFPVGGSEQLFDLESDPQELCNLAHAAEASSHLERLRTELIDRHQARGSAAVEHGNWVTLPVPIESEADRRNTSWPGYHTEFYHIDVRH
ncbi:MAG: hypothetical protein OXI52_09830, partial [Caldilineaceae bacterium]|nr:hypothetical protein [Caldilineaceae bacterium]